MSWRALAPSVSLVLLLAACGGDAAPGEADAGTGGSGDAPTTPGDSTSAADAPDASIEDGVVAADTGGGAADATGDVADAVAAGPDTPDAAGGGDAAEPGDGQGPADAGDGAGGADGAGDDGGPIPALPFCEGATTFLYDPTGGLALETFPDDYYTVEDPTTATGLRVRMDATLAPWVPAIPGDYDQTFAQLQELDGFGTTAAIILRFSGPVTDVPTGEAPPSPDRLRLVDLDAGATPIPFEVQPSDDDTALLLWPMVPLAAGHRHGVIATRDLLAKDGACVAPSATLKKLVGGTATDPRLTRLLPRYAELLEKTGVAPEDVSAAVVFTTQTIVTASVAAASDITARHYAWLDPPTCVDGPLWRQCDGAFLAFDYRDAAGVVVDGTPQTPYTLAARVWLPLGDGGPWPVVIFGHGLGSDRGQAKALADKAAPMGIATVAIDAVAHGEHPGAPDNPTTLVSVMAFFGISLDTLALDALVLRDNWRQSTYDKLQLVRLLLDAPDLDGDGTPELDPAHMGYFGVSLGGIMGSELLALTPAIGAAILSVPGGRVSSIMGDSDTFAPLLFGLTPPGATQWDVVRFFPVLQALIERGDASNWAPHVLADRLPGMGAPPQLLLNMALGDETVPNSCTRSLARALGVPTVPPVLQSIGIVGTTEPAPVAGNLGPSLTAGLFQYDRVTKSEGEAPVPAAHDNVSKSVEGLLQETHFLQTWLSTGAGEIVDPYAILGTPPL